MVYVLLLDRLERAVSDGRIVAGMQAAMGAQDVVPPDLTAARAEFDAYLLEPPTAAAARMTPWEAAQRRSLGLAVH